MNTPPRLRLLYLALAVVLPWSAEINIWPDSVSKIVFPAELLMAFIGVLLLWHLRPVDTFRKNQNLLWLSAGLFWGWVCVLFSALPVVSLKYMVVTTACWWVFLLPSLQWRFIFQEVAPVFLLSLAAADLRLVLTHGFYYGFRADQANLPGLPFFDDHNLSAALNVMGVFVLWAIPPLERHWQSVRYILTTVLLISIFTSTSRGAVLSFAGAGVLLAGMLYFKKFPLLKTLTIIVSVGIAVAFFGADNIRQAIQRDVSMMERINRYQCAQRMAEARPVTGFGPGTFALTYHPYQRISEKTRISIDQPFTERSPENYGRGGGAHSEFFQALAETGWPGLVFLCLFWGIIFTKCSVGTNFELSRSGTSFLLAGLASYLFHGMINNFSHDVRMMFLMWVVLGRLCTSDFFDRDQKPEAGLTDI